MIDNLSSFLDYWKNARARTVRILDRIPEHDLEWSYAPHRFTFGDLFRHLAAIERYMYAETVIGNVSAYAGHSRALADGLDAVRGYVDRCHAESLAIFESIGDAGLLRKCITAAGTPITVWKWLRAMVEHEAHHRGQLYVMASMRGISIPPLFGLTEEEVVARSKPTRVGG